MNVDNQNCNINNNNSTDINNGQFKRRNYRNGNQFPRGGLGFGRLNVGFYSGGRFRTGNYYYYFVNCYLLFVT